MDQFWGETLKYQSKGTELGKRPYLRNRLVLVVVRPHNFRIWPLLWFVRIANSTYTHCPTRYCKRKSITLYIAGVLVYQSLVCRLYISPSGSTRKPITFDPLVQLHSNFVQSSTYTQSRSPYKDFPWFPLVLSFGPNESHSCTTFLSTSHLLHRNRYLRQYLHYRPINSGLPQRLSPWRAPATVLSNSW